MTIQLLKHFGRNKVHLQPPHPRKAINDGQTDYIFRPVMNERIGICAIECGIFSKNTRGGLYI
jgi:hypothetical protein